MEVMRVNESEAWIWISLISGLSVTKVNRLLEKYCSVYTISELRESELRENLEEQILTNQNIRDILDPKNKIKAQEIFENLYKKNIGTINITDNRYPYLLKQIYNPPILLYYRGNCNFDTNSIAVVGSRRTTKYGSSTAKKMCYQLSLRGINIISGMATGIDSFAHQGCIDANGFTTAVLACGVDHPYPASNIKLYNDILENNGLIVSEYPPGTLPLKHHFPLRNRIISGLSQGVLVVEAAKKSGSLITATYALEQGREVFAVPGNIDAVLSEGTNQLIRDGAKMVSGIDDIINELSICDISEKSFKGENEHAYQNNKEVEQKLFKLFRGLSTNEIRVVKNIICGFNTLDEIIEKSSLPAQEVIMLLFMLEMKGVVEKEAGNNYKILNSAV